MVSADSSCARSTLRAPGTIQGAPLADGDGAAKVLPVAQFFSKLAIQISSDPVELIPNCRYVGGLFADVYHDLNGEGEILGGLHFILQ